VPISCFSYGDGDGDIEIEFICFKVAEIEEICLGTSGFSGDEVIFSDT